MTQALLPIIEELASAASHAERARWLLTAPLSVLVTYAFTINNRLLNAHFPDGVAYLDCELVAARARRADGLAIKTNPMRGALISIAENRPYEGESDHG